MEKVEILSNFYAIRAGLSYLFCRKKEIDGYSNQLSQLNQERQDLIKSVSDHEKSVSDKKYEEASKKYPYPKLKKKYGVYYFLTAVRTMIIIGFIATGGYWGYLYYRNKNFQAVSNWWTERGLDANPILSLLGLVVAGGLGVLIFIVVGLIGILIGNNDRIYSFTEKANKASREAEIKKMDTLREKYVNAHLLSKRHQKEMDALKKYVDFEVTKKDESIQVVQAKIDALTNDGTAFYQKMVNSFSEVIKPVDWKHIDLLIYYFETGRTDTIKEALVLLEHQIQSNQISETITLAQNEIQKKLSNLESAINQVQTGIENINSRMSSLISGISRLSDKISSFESFSETLYSDLKATQLTSSYIMAKAIEKASNKEYYKVDIMNY